jgi:hypothetical protein
MPVATFMLFMPLIHEDHFYGHAILPLTQSLVAGFNAINTIQESYAMDALILLIKIVSFYQFCNLCF